MQSQHFVVITTAESSLKMWSVNIEYLLSNPLSEGEVKAKNLDI